MTVYIGIDRIDSRIEVAFQTGCWLWTGSLHSKGYSSLWLKKTYLGHRLFYEVLVGPIPDGLQLDHLCRVRHCVNPAHLEAVTPRENVMRGVGLAAQNARKTHCIHGHEFTESNTRWLGGRYRVCRTCHNGTLRELRKRRKETS